ncbi:matrixin family metalloprotease [Thermoproteota archaeon]
MSNIARFKIKIKTAKRGEKDPEIEKVQKYLTRFGYLRTTVRIGKLDYTTSKSIKLFQQCFGLKVTGDLTAETVKAMESKRCGTPDIGIIESSTNGESAVSNFTQSGCKYTHHNFTYQFLNGTTDITGTTEHNAIRNAFTTWDSVLCGVTFQELTSGSTNFLIGWFTGNHGDGYPFDGIGNTLAHAFFPPPCGGSHAGNLHFDDAETFSLTGTGTTLDLETVGLHEIGHLLGLRHSSVNGSVMFPTYGGVRRNLTQDDIDGIRELYPFLCRRGDSEGQAGFVGEITAIKHQNNQVVTAVRTQTATLMIIAWRVDTNGSISRTGDSGGQAGKASWISIAKNPSDSRYVTAVRTALGNLMLISWDINNNGSSIARQGDSGNQAGRANMIHVAAVENNRFVTAVRIPNTKRLKLINWRLNTNDSLTRLADSGNTVGVVRNIAMVNLSGGRVLTAVRTANGTLKLITWKVTDSEVTRLGDSGNQAGNARDIRLTIDGFGNVITAVKQANDNLKLITWRLNSSGSIQRLGDSGNLAGVTRGHDISLADGNIITAVRTKEHTLKIIVWSTTVNGTVNRVGDSDELAGNASMITLNEGLSGVPPIITSVRTENSSLKLISWNTS